MLAEPHGKHVKKSRQSAVLGLTVDKEKGPQSHNFKEQKLADNLNLGVRLSISITHTVAKFLFIFEK